MAGMMELKGCRIIVKEIAGGKRVLDTRIKSYDPIRKVQEAWTTGWSMQ